MEYNPLLLLAIGGLFFSIISILEKYVKWILSFCDIFGTGCRKALKYHLFGIPVSWYGAAYYLFLMILIHLMEPWVFWFIMVGFGIELTFVWIMIYIRAFCIFCSINAMMMTGLFLYSFDKNRIPASLSIISVFFMISLYLLFRENIWKHSGVLEIDKDPSMGPDDALVVIAEFSDYLCPGCRKAHEFTKTIKDKYKGRIRWVFKDFPLEHHAGADRMAEAAHCANDQGKFWDYQDLLFSSEKTPDSQQLIEYAKILGLDDEKFRNCMGNRKYQSKVENNVKNGKEMGISAIPTFIINGKMILGVPSPEKFEKIIKKALSKNSWVK